MDFHRSTKNVVWNLIGGAWNGVLIILATPWFVSRLGLEGYGVLGFWLVLQVVMGLLDFGMGATLSKEFAGSRNAHNSLLFKRDLLRTFEVFYWAVSVAIVLFFVLAAPFVVTHWLNITTLPEDTVVNAIRLMAISLGLQFPFYLYLNGLAGLQAHGRMNIIHVLGNTLRYGGGAAVLLWRADLVWFFAAQVLSAMFQTFAIRCVVWRLINEFAQRTASFRFDLVRRMWRFSFGMGVTSMSAVLLANVDRIALSKMLPAEELGKYAIAFTATGVLQLGIQPFYRAFFPRYSELVSLGDVDQLSREYFRSCRLMAIVIIPIGCVGWFFAPQLFDVWLGEYDKSIIVIFRWLLVGITCSGLMWLPAAFQQAHGWARLHASMIVGALVVGMPIMTLAITFFGTVGATTVWLLHGASDITLGLWLMHRRLLTGRLIEWYRSALVPPLLISGLVIGLSWCLMPDGLNKWLSFFWVVASGFLMVTLGLFFEKRFHNIKKA